MLTEAGPTVKFTHKTSCQNIVADQDVSTCSCSVSAVQVSFEGLRKPFPFLILKNESFPLIIGFPAMKQLQNRIDSIGQMIKMRIADKLVMPEMDYDRFRTITELQITDREDFTAERE